MGVCSVFTLLLCGQTTFPWAVAFVSSTMGLATFSHRYRLRVQRSLSRCLPPSDPNIYRLKRKLVLV